MTIEETTAASAPEAASFTNPPENTFFAEWVYYDDDESLEEAKAYLLLWKRFLLQKFSVQAQCIGEIFTQRPPVKYFPRGTIALQFEVSWEKNIEA